MTNVKATLEVESNTWYAFIRLCNEEKVSACEMLEKLIRAYAKES